MEPGWLYAKSIEIIVGEGNKIMVEIQIFMINATNTLSNTVALLVVTIGKNLIRS